MAAPLNANLIKTVTSAGYLSAQRGQPRSREDKEPLSAKESHELLKSTRRVEIDSHDDLSYYYHSNPAEQAMSGGGGEVHTPFRVLRFDQFKKRQQSGGSRLRVPLELAKERANEFNRTLLWGGAEDGMLLTDESDVSLTRGADFQESGGRRGLRVMSEQRKRRLEKSKS